MAADINDFFTATKTAGTTRPVATTLSAQKLVGATSASIQAATGWETGTAVHGIMYRVDANNTKVAGSQIDWKAVLSGTTLNNFTVTAGTDDTYAIGAVVELSPTAAWADDLVTGITTSLDQDGTLKAGAVDVTAVVADSIISRAKLTSGFGTEFTTGWVTGDLPAVSSVTANGNRSYDITFASTVASTLSPGMRLRTTRTVAAPTQCTSLNGTTQYYSKTSPNKLTFTDDFVVSAWVKLSAYNSGAAQMIVSRYNGTSGWGLYVQTSGQIELAGWNAASANFSRVVSYQSIPLNKWVHITAQLDMSSFTATTTTSYVMLDGKDVPCSVSRAGTNPTTLLQAGDLCIGAHTTGLLPFSGKIAQVAIFNAKVTQATAITYYSQGLSGSETSLASAYSFNNSITDLNTTTPNDLTANGSAVATNADSPFGNNGVSSTLDYALVQAVSGSTATVSVPEGCTIATSGGVTSVAYSVQGNPYGYRDPGNVIGYAEIRATATATTQADVGGLTSTVYVPSGRSVRIVFDCFHMADNIGSGLGNYTLYIMEGATQLASTTMTSIGSGFTRGVHREVEFTPTAGSHTYKIQMSSATGTVTLTAAATSPAFMSVQLIPQA